MAMNSSIKNPRLLITGTLLPHKHQLRDFFNRYACLQQLTFPGVFVEEFSRDFPVPVWS